MTGPMKVACVFIVVMMIFCVGFATGVSLEGRKAERNAKNILASDTVRIRNTEKIEKLNVELIRLLDTKIEKLEKQGER